MYAQYCGPRERLGRLVCEACASGICETPPLLVERMIAKSTAFTEYVAPPLQLHLGVRPEQTVKHVQKVDQLLKPSYIRTPSEEASSFLHALLRYGIKRGLMEGPPGGGRRAARMERPDEGVHGSGDDGARRHRVPARHPRGCWPVGQLSRLLPRRCAARGGQPPTAWQCRGAAPPHGPHGTCPGRSEGDVERGPPERDGGAG
ncbi:hypothetical protein GH5_00676 [Leishmania sp. Ghana 2012 LV757]|uniref:hypothetical protein n=1 Tax=Leishmania sp. Ghana 2012 LV757 TaxID=2803181 RepID=UPI001B57147F|nr:hypothetical protein GH5_00676 [Leishmania sp. Ghana 2012 LV757]